jgi:hypothetical protein
MKAKKGKHFPIVGGNIADECPVCSSVIVGIGFNCGICPSCAREEIIELRKQVARLTKRAADNAKRCARCSVEIGDECYCGECWRA